MNQAPLSRVYNYCSRLKGGGGGGGGGGNSW